MIKKVQKKGRSYPLGILVDLWYHTVTAGTIFLFLFSLYCNVRIARTTSAYIYDSLKEVPYTKVGLLLGTSKHLRGGYENPYFTYRVRAAASLYRAGKIDYILASGDNSKEWYNEPLHMKKDLLRAGVPEERVYLDYAGFRTLDSVVRAGRIFGQEAVIIISQPFHNRRAVYIARHSGLDAVGYNSRDVGGRFGQKTRVREYFARVKAFLDVHVIKTQPRFLGERISIP
jgi:SanA protein